MSLVQITSFSIKSSKNIVIVLLVTHVIHIRKLLVWISIDILRNQIQRNISFEKQSSLIKNSCCCHHNYVSHWFYQWHFLTNNITFQNKELWKIGCGIYLLTITMFAISQSNCSSIGLRIYRSYLLVLLLNELSMFSKELTSINRRMIFILPILILGTLVHALIQHDLFE